MTPYPGQKFVPGLAEGPRSDNPIGHAGDRRDQILNSAGALEVVFEEVVEIVRLRETSPLTLRRGPGTSGPKVTPEANQLFRGAGGGNEEQAVQVPAVVGREIQANQSARIGNAGFNDFCEALGIVLGSGEIAGAGGQGQRNELKVRTAPVVVEEFCGNPPSRWG